MLVIGAAGLDIVGRPADVLQLGTSNPGYLRTSPGGVARNIAENLARLGLETSLITAVGDDPAGHQLLEDTARAGVQVDRALTISDQPTGSYLALLDHRGAMQLGLDDMRCIEAITPEHVASIESDFEAAALIALDANLSPETIDRVLELATRHRIPVAADPTSRSLAVRLEPHLRRLLLITPNEAEAEVYAPHPVPHADHERALDAARYLVKSGVAIAIVTMAEFGVTYATATQNGHIPAQRTEVVDPTGAGDALTAAMIFGLLNAIPLDEAVRLAVSAAALTLRASGSVREDLSLELLYDQLV